MNPIKTRIKNYILPLFFGSTLSLFCEITPEISQFLSEKCNYSSEQIRTFEQTQEGMKIELNGFFLGTIFSKKPYTKEERSSFLDSLHEIVKKQFTPKTWSQSPSYISTAGAPGVGKSYFIENHCNIDYESVIYTDPDRICLIGLQAYQEDCKKHGDAYAYEKWRDASNFMANFLLVKACTESRNIVHGTTATSPRIIDIYKHLKAVGYTITIELLFATVEQRAASLQHRAQNMIQVTEEDARGKSKPVFSRITDTYFVHANTVNLHFQKNEFWKGEGEAIFFAQFNQNKRELAFYCNDGKKAFDNELATELTQEEICNHDNKIKKLGITPWIQDEEEPNVWYPINREVYGKG